MNKTRPGPLAACLNTGEHKQPKLACQPRTTEAASFRFGRQYALTLTYAFDLT